LKSARREHAAKTAAEIASNNLLSEGEIKRFSDAILLVVERYEKCCKKRPPRPSGIVAELQQIHEKAE
jgi:hypothetical protein